jgi:hypothetical protein
MPEIAPLRQVSPGYAPKGGHSSPGLKTWGFLASFINVKKNFNFVPNLLQSKGLKGSIPGGESFGRG